VPYKSLYLIAGDVIVAAASLLTGFMVRFGPAAGRAELARRSFATFFLVVFVLVVCSYIFEDYNLVRRRSNKEMLADILIAVCVSFVTLSMSYFIIPRLIIGRGLLALSLAVFVIYQFLWHMLFVIIQYHPSFAERVLVFGTGEAAKNIGDFIRSSNNGFSHVLAGYVAAENGSEPVAVPGELIVGRVDDLPAVARREKVSQIVVSLQERRGNSSLRHVLLNCKLQGVKIIDAPTFFEPLTGKLMIENMDMNWLIYSDGFRRTPLYAAVKRTIDVLLSFVGIVVSLPFFPLIAALIKLDSPGPVFFTQTRVGQGEENFTLYKFRTMSENCEQETGAVWAQENDPRIRSIGRFLRKWRIDELPQLYNVIKGDMSFVGPRPERPEFVTELDWQIPFYAKRHFIKPGITGWAQVQYPYGSSVEDAYEKLRYDLYYFKNMSLFQDIKIILKTFRVVIFGRGR
jgi:sugar transferase (PEP-CTERM system associated)